MIIDSLHDPYKEIRNLVARIRALETAAPLNHSSISRGATRILTAAGDPLAAIGHIDGKSGLLMRVGNEWRTAEEHIDARVAAGTAQPNARIRDLEGRVATAEGNITKAQSTATSAASAASAAQGTAGTALSTANGKASQSSVTALTAKLNEVIDKLNTLEEQVRGFHPTKPVYPPITKGDMRIAISDDDFRDALAVLRAGANGNGTLEPLLDSFDPEENRRLVIALAALAVEAIWRNGETVKQFATDVAADLFPNADENR